MGYPGNSRPVPPAASYQYNSQPPNPSFSNPNSNYPLPPPEPYSYQPFPVASPMPMQQPAPFYPDAGPNPPFYQPNPAPFPSPLHTQVQYVPPSSSFRGDPSASSTSSSHHLPPYPIETVNDVLRIKGCKKALLVGINYTNSQSPLRGCIKDVMRVKSFLINRYGFKDTPQTMVTLTDDQTVSHFIPTRQNIITAMQWLVAGAAPGHSLFFHFSGHGGQKADVFD
ncbi:Ca(2+)-dependent cysteine protease [Coelomomyces lativittatus]|nr:Ca(2+)-dependent cysteine protease [Coelomomyces lativittatus]